MLRSLEHVKETALGSVNTFGNEALWIRYDRNANSDKQIEATNALHNPPTLSGLTVLRCLQNARAPLLLPQLPTVFPRHPTGSPLEALLVLDAYQDRVRA